MRHLGILCSLLLLAGCTMDVQRLHDLNPPATDFSSSLASEYQAYADSESEQGRFWSAEHYADKGLKALKRETVEPDMPDSSLSAAQQQDLADARAQLMKTLTDEVKKAAPGQAARSQLLFDCWQHELSKNIDQATSPCGDEFHSTFSQLQEISDPLIYGKIIRHTIIFAPKTAKLDADSLNTINEVAKRVATLPHYRIQLDAYVGIKASQRKLSDQRLTAVRHALIKAGVNEHTIHIKKEGHAKAVILSEDNPPMDTKKVTITIKIRNQHREHQT